MHRYIPDHTTGSPGLKSLSNSSSVLGERLVKDLYLATVNSLSGNDAICSDTASGSAFLRCEQSYSLRVLSYEWRETSNSSNAARILVAANPSGLRSPPALA
jgi:hypothetical protein